MLARYFILFYYVSAILQKKHYYYYSKEKFGAPGCSVACPSLHRKVVEARWESESIFFPLATYLLCIYPRIYCKALYLSQVGLFYVYAN